MILAVALALIPALVVDEPGTAASSSPQPAPAVVSAPAPASTTTTTQTSKPDAAKADAAKPEARKRVLVLDFKVANAAPEMGTAVANVVAVELGTDERFDVVTTRDLRALIEREASKEAIGGGCDVEAAQCLAEIADALGAQLVVYGDVGKLESTYLINMNLFDAEHATGLSRANVEVTNADDVPSRVASAARGLIGRETGPGPLPIAAAVVAGTGVVVALIGSAGALAAFSVETDPAKSGQEKQDALNAHPTWSIAAAAGAVVAVAAAAVTFIAWQNP